MQAQDYYQLLGVSRLASSEMVRHAFRARMLDMHPDLHPNDALACERTRHLVEAYKTLSNPTARRDYDTSLATCEVAVLEWSCAEQNQLPILNRQALALLMVALAVLMLFWAVRAATNSRTRVYRFHITNLWTDGQQIQPPLLVEPEMSSALVWYAAVQYQLRHSSAVVSQSAREAYERAVSQAARHGDRTAAEFYRQSLAEMQRTREQNSLTFRHKSSAARARPV